MDTAVTEERERIRWLVGDELARIEDSPVRETLRALLVTPYAVKRPWDYGAPDEAYLCWTVLEHSLSNTAIAYCEHGFGPQYPWGLVFLSGHMSIGMDSGWFATLEAAFRDGMAWDGDNPIGYEVD